MRKFLWPWLPLILVFLLSSGCDRLQIFSGAASSAATTLSLEQVAPSGQPGQYSLQGKAALPDGTRLSVSAVRAFELESSGLAENPANPDETPQYAILDRQFAQVSQGSWQTNLQLWQTAADGRYQENWQLGTPTPPDGAAPSATVTFLVTLEPRSFSQAVDDKQVETLSQSNSAILRFTDAGESYLQVGQTVAVALPMGQASSTQRAQATSEDPWKGRSSLNAAAADFGKAPELPFEENDNLPLPESNMLR